MVIRCFQQYILIVVERFIRTLKSKINKKWQLTILNLLNKLIVKYKNSCHHFTGKKPIDADYSVLPAEINLQKWFSDCYCS